MENVGYEISITKDGKGAKKYFVERTLILLSIMYDAMNIEPIT